MPTCDLCGRVFQKLKRAKIEEAVLDVCDYCATRGEIIRTPADAGRGLFKVEREVNIVSDEVVAGFGKIISGARKKMEWDVKKLAEVLHAKESLMHKVEAGKIKPDLEFAHKIEHVLRVRLVEKPLAGEVGSTTGNGGGMTMGDFIKIKKK